MCTSSTAASAWHRCSRATPGIGAFARTVPVGTWITGGDWDHTLWSGELPQRDWIDAARPDHPVWVNRLDGHMALANTAARRAVNLTRSVQNVDGGEIVRDRRGELTGLLKDDAMAPVDDKMPPPRRDARPRAAGGDGLPAAGQEHQLLRLRVGQRAKQHAVDDREARGVGADAQGQRQHRDAANPGYGAGFGRRGGMSRRRWSMTLLGRAPSHEGSTR